MEVLVLDLINSCDYKLNYFHKVLREKNINNRIILDKDDLVKLRTTLKVVNRKTYVLRIYLDNLFYENKIKVVS